MSMLIWSNPDVFVDSAGLVGDTGFQESPFTSEDLHRAFQLLKFHLRHRSAARSESSFYDSTEDAPVRPIQYFTPEDLVTARNATSGDLEEAADAVHPMEQLARAEEEGPDLEADPDRTFVTEEDELDAGADMLEGVVAQSEFEVDPQRSGIKQARPPLSWNAQRALCARLAKKVRVLHEENWTELQAGGPEEVPSDFSLSHPMLTTIRTRFIEPWTRARRLATLKEGRRVSDELGTSGA